MHSLEVVVALPTVEVVDYVKNPKERQAATHVDELAHAEQTPLFG